MTPAELRRALAGSYDVEAGSGVFVSRRAAEFTYSDGAAAEAYLAQAVRGASDLGVGSPELARAIRDWPSQYHLSPARANLLRPFADALRGRSVLEIGSGCGAITRFIAECGATVLALEGSIARARITAARCRDLENGVVVCDNFDGAPITAQFDIVMLIGALEYARVFLQGGDPVQAMLEAARARLAPGGALVVAIENQLGLKYLAGAREDHLGEPYIGVTDLYGPRTPVTFGLAELRGRLRRAGFEDAECYYPFPDYKLPAAIVAGAAFSHPAFNAADLLATSHGHRFDDPGPLAYSEALCRDVFIRNGLGPDTANSFLAWCRTSASGGGASLQRPWRRKPGLLACAYTADRSRPFAGEASFVEKGESVEVRRRALFPQARPVGGKAMQVRPEVEAYLEGEVLYRGVQRLAARQGWTVEQVADWAAPWIAFVEQQAGDAPVSEGERAERPLPPHLFDCTPFNVIRRPNGTLAAFDLEWQAAGDSPITLARVAFRGLYNALLRLDFVAPPAAGVPADIASLVAAVMLRLGVGVSVERLHAWISSDYELTGLVAGTPRASAMPDLPRLRVRPEAPAPSSSTARERELESILARPHHRLATWFGALIEPFPKLRAMARAPFDGFRRPSPPRMGAIVHLHYEDLWPEMRSYLRRIPSLAKLYVSIAEDAGAGTEARIAADFPGASVRRMPNRGRDVLPFLQWLEVAASDGVELVCKIHTKRSPHLPTGDAWRRDMLEKLLGSEAVVRDIVESFRADPKLGILGPGGHVVPSSFFWERNAARVEAQCARMGFDVRGVEFRFVAGSMFWARTAALAPLRRLGLRAEDFDAEPAPADGTLAHAMERCFPIAVRIAGYRTGESANPAGTRAQDFAP